jgi:NADH:ubiquinone reductase (H+-translocating)
MSDNPTRVLILGGGFAGLSAARAFERQLREHRRSVVTLVSRDNYVLFTPMLAEVASGEVDSSHIATPTRAFLRGVHARQGEVVAIDLEQHCVQLFSPAVQDQTLLPFDQLILALGSVTTFRHAPGAAEHSFPFKHLGDAQRIHDRVLDCFDWAAAQSDPAQRRALLTFVVAGGGFAGSELAASLADFVRDALRFYPRVMGESARVLLVHHGARLVEELPESASAYTHQRLQQQGVDVRMRTAVTEVTASCVMLQPGGMVLTRTVLWTAGVAPNPVLADLDLPKDKHGAIVVDAHLRVPGRPELWAIGDCASIPDTGTGGTYGPLAQNALREGPVVAHNVLATVEGSELQTLNYHPQGLFASLGTRHAVGEIYGRQISGLLAWFLWRTVYLSKLPGLDRKIRVGSDWLLDLLFPPDLIALHAGTRGPYNMPPPTDDALHRSDLAAAQSPPVRAVGAFGLPRDVRACLFDLDGVLTETAAVHAAAWKETFDGYLRSRSARTGEPFVAFDAIRDYETYVDGKPRDDGTRSFLQSRGIVLPEGTSEDPPEAETIRGLGIRKNMVFLQRLRDQSVTVFPGSLRYLQAMRSAGLHVAVVSSSKNTTQVLEAAGLRDSFDAQVDGLTAARDGLRGKPTPDTYLAAAQALHALPAQAAVFEDALAGVEAGRAGGFGWVVGVDRLGQRDALLHHGADVVVADLAELLADVENGADVRRTA